MTRRRTTSSDPTMRSRPRVLIICDYYLPGFESGGAVRTLANLVDRLGDRYEFPIVTRDHDGTAVRTPYSTVKRGDWNEVGRSSAYYLRPDQVRAGEIARLINDTEPDAIYLNSFFSRLTILFLALLRLRRVPQLPVVLAPEGEFSLGALALGRLKKSAYIAAARPLLLSKQILWKAASNEEADDIRRVIGPSARILIAPNMPPRLIYPEYSQGDKPRKQPGSARLIFLSRFMRKKNFNWLLGLLHEVKGNLEIDIYGTLEEPDYLAEFYRLAADLPQNIRLAIKEVVPHERVGETLFSYDFFILPTLGENFGHVMIEALASGCPPIISDRTPWTGLRDKGIGWDLPLEAPGVWVEVLNDAISMPDSAYQRMAASARRYAEDWLADPIIEHSNGEVLDAALQIG